VPELPDVTVYVESLIAHVRGTTLDGIRLASRGEVPLRPQVALQLR